MRLWGHYPPRAARITTLSFGAFRGPRRGAGRDAPWQRGAWPGTPRSPKIEGSLALPGRVELWSTTLDFQPKEIRGSGDLWIAEGLLSYDGGDPLHYVKIMEFRGEKVARETLSFEEPFPAPEWRKPWAAEGPRPTRQHDLPAHVLGGN
ncbi:hypothetical protein MIPYR_10749 [uncultured Microbacterium sp.]|uniref:SnoaL-like domain-containing protein n=1 Tax=uncultured Microbacterium sp. TaxID=191216 RepID=A0A1Y5P4C0_9MICO|nr:hypothetical protein MIPYR_10749 [uncultured Microbacterium sp.]